MIKLSKRRNRKFKTIAECPQCDGKYRACDALMYYVLEPVCNKQKQRLLPFKLKPPPFILQDAINDPNHIYKRPLFERNWPVAQSKVSSIDSFQFGVRKLTVQRFVCCFCKGLLTSVRHKLMEAPSVEESCAKGGAICGL